MELTIGQLWSWLAGGPVSEDLVEWAPDVAALTSVLLERSHAFRFVVSPPAGARWPPTSGGSFTALVASCATRWRWAMEHGESPGGEVDGLWRLLLDHQDTPVAHVSEGVPWTVCEAALTLHAIADEACAHNGRHAPPGSTFTARAQELLVRTGSTSRLPSDRVTHLPKSRTTSVGITHRSLSRYGSTTTDGIRVQWDTIPVRRRGERPVRRHANVMLLPWPLVIHESDFVALPGSVRRPEREPYGFFTFEPSEGLDLSLVERLLDAALEEADSVDVVVLPEGCLNESEVDALEALLGRRGVGMLVTGVRPPPPGPGLLPRNVLHTGLRLHDRWWRYRQNKHHRWFLDGRQVETYNIAGALHPTVRWWEAMDIPERRVHFLELGGGVTVTAVVCEDLARLDGVAALLRSVGPTLVLTLLLDGPQLGSRWTARYAGVLADDPGSAVLTLTPMGMVSRSRPDGVPPSRIVAMWKDPQRGMREIPMEPGAQGVLLKLVLETSPRHAADGREPVDDVTDLHIAGVHQLVAGPATGPSAESGAGDRGETLLPAQDLTVVAAWAHAVADAVHNDPTRVSDVLRAAEPAAPWRRQLGLPVPADTLAQALHLMTDMARDAESSGDLHAELSQPQPDESGLAALVRVILLASLETARR